MTDIQNTRTRDDFHMVASSRRRTPELCVTTHPKVLTSLQVMIIVSRRRAHPSG